MRGVHAGLRWAAVVAAVAGTVLPARPAAAIEGGWDADAAHYPYQVAVEYRGAHICAGSVLGPSSVLAPAHCADVMSTAALTVSVGTVLRKADGSDPAARGLRQRVAGVAVHPGYDPSTRAADVAVLTLSTPLALGDGLRAVALPAQGTDPAPGTTATVSGWGATSTQTSRSPKLRAARVTVVPRTVCAAAPAAVAATAPSAVAAPVPTAPRPVSPPTVAPRPVAAPAAPTTPAQVSPAPVSAVPTVAGELCAVPERAHLRRGDDGNPLIAGDTLLGITAVPEQPGADGNSGSRFVNIGAYSAWIRTAARLPAASG
ncbi:serine protease [Kitasatospora sp. NPDC048365]|uniref:serine protease n=1 Tax=Kitasatospora sp. NPDC048365 TaxID=3364050 RepID=UPI0037153C74